MLSIEEKIFTKVMQLAKPSGNKASLEVKRKNHERVLGLVSVPKNIIIQHMEDQDIAAEWLSTEDGDTENGILYFHGGGYVVGTVTSAKAVASRITAESNFGALTFQYRLAPENPFPAALLDAASIYRYLLKQGILPEHIAFVGESAGGGLELSLCHYLADHQLPMPKCVVAMSPWTDLSLSGISYTEKEADDPILTRSALAEDAKMYASGQNLENPYISPLFGSFEGFPPTLIHVGSHEVLLDDSVEIAKKMKQQGVNVELKIWEEMWHVFQGYGTPTSKQAISEISAFLHRQFQTE